MPSAPPGNPPDVRFLDHICARFSPLPRGEVGGPPPGEGASELNCAPNAHPSDQGGVAARLLLSRDGLRCLPMSDPLFQYRLGPARRAVALAFTLFIVYPRMVGRFIFLRPPSFDTVIYLVLSPWLIYRNVLSTFFSSYPLPFDLDYVVELCERYCSFGPGEKRNRMANSYSTIKDSFRIRGKRTLLLRDGWLIFLPPGDDGETAWRTIHEKRTQK